jgi:hypothetical protein
MKRRLERSLALLLSRGNITYLKIGLKRGRVTGPVRIPQRIVPCQMRFSNAVKIISRMKNNTAPPVK